MDGIGDMVFFPEIQPNLWMTLVLYGNAFGRHDIFYMEFRTPFPTISPGIPVPSIGGGQGMDKKWNGPI